MHANPGLISCTFKAIFMPSSVPLVCCSLTTLLIVSFRSSLGFPLFRPSPVTLDVFLLALLLLLINLHKCMTSFQMVINIHLRRAAKRTGFGLGVATPFKGQLPGVFLCPFPLMRSQSQL